MGLGSIFKKVGGAIIGGLTGNPLATIGTGLELLGGAKKVFDGDGPNPNQQAYGQLKGAFRAADEAGLHRLAVAGSPAGYSPVPSQAADGLMQAGQALRSQSNAKKEAELLDAQIEEARSRTALNNANAKRAFLGPQPGLGGFTGSRISDIVSAHRDRLGGPRGVKVEPERDVPLTGSVGMGDTTVVSPSEDAFSVGLDELIAGALIYGPQWLTAQIRRLGAQGRDGPEPPSRAGARDRSRGRERKAQQSPYLFPRR